jgi:hypothetical protein
MQREIPRCDCGNPIAQPFDLIFVFQMTALVLQGALIF